MSASGAYEERLPCGGTLKVTKSSWEIRYYFPGPDMRYNGTFVTVPGRSIELFISAFKSNWSEYEQLKASLPGGGSYTKIGAQGMTINVGGYYDGVCIQSHYMPIKSQHRLTQVISSYQYAAKRAPEIKGFLAGL